MPIQVTWIPEFQFTATVQASIAGVRGPNGEWMLNLLSIDANKLFAEVKHQSLASQFVIHHPDLIAALDAKEAEEAAQGIVRSPA